MIQMAQWPDYWVILQNYTLWMRALKDDRPPAQVSLSTLTANGTEIHEYFIISGNVGTQDLYETAIRSLWAI